MVRVQVYLPEDEDHWLEEQARVRCTTKSALIREGVKRLQQRLAEEEEHMLKLIGLAGPDPEGATDVSERHDWYLTEWELQRNGSAETQ